MRKTHCDVLMVECEEVYSSIKKEIQLKCLVEQKDEFFIPKVKTLLEHMRSILDFCAQDIFELVIPEVEKENKMNSKYKKVYFPYGKNKRSFEKSIRSNLPGLNSNDRIYRIIEEIQDYKRVDNKKFLYYMCSLTNENKHNHLSEQGWHSNGTTVEIGKFLKTQNSNVVIRGGTYNGIPLGNFEINKNGEIKGNINPSILSQIVTYDEGVAVFKDSGKNVVEFLGLCLKEINEFYNVLYAIVVKRI